MQKEGASTFFYESKWKVGFLFFMITEIVIALLWGLSVSCPPGRIQLVVQAGMFIGPLLFFVTKLKSVGKAILKADEQEIAFSGLRFRWEEITQISLEKNRNRKELVPLLKIECGKIPYFLQLRYMSDNERRLMLDELEKHKPIRYNGCDYEKNYAAWDMGFLIFAFMAEQIGLACAILMAIIQSQL